MKTKLLFTTFFLCILISNAQNLIAYYPFNGNPNDESGNTINPTYIGAGVKLTTDRFGNANKAYNFDGATGSYIKMPADLLPTTNRTISLWFYVPDVTNRPGLMGYGGNGSCGTTLLMGLNLLGAEQFYVQGHCGNNASGYSYSSPPVNNWYHWVLTINGSSQKIYVNGQLKNTDNTFSGSTAVSGKDFSLGVITSISGIAPYTDMNVGYLNGKLDDVRIYVAAMTDEQVLSLYKTESLGLVAFYPFNGNTNDESGNGNNATYIGSGVTLTTDRFGEANKAFYFDGAVGSYIRIPADKFPTVDRTISFWFNADSFTNGPTPVSYGGNGCNSSCFLVLLNRPTNNAYNVSGHCNDSNIAATYTAPPVAEWKHWVITINGTTQKIYINGILKQTSSNYVGPTYVAGKSFVIGGLLYPDGTTVYVDAGGSGYFKGKLDEFRIYNNPMTDEQVLSIYNTESRGLVAYYPFNGNANDESGNENHGTVNGATLTTDRFGNANKAYNFTNPNHISVPNSNLFGDEFSVSYWFKISYYAGQRGVMSNVAIPNGGFQQAFDGSTFTYIFGYNFPLSSDPLWSNYTMQEAINQWHHLVMTYKKTGTTSSESKLFINGELKKTSDHQGLSILFTPNAPFYIGQNHSGLNFQGDLDEIQIYNKVLSAAEAQELYASEATGLVAYYPFNGNANDESGNSHNGTVIGSTLTTDRFGNENSAYSFDGNDIINIAHSDMLNVSNQLTISVWVKPNSFPSSANVMIVGKSNYSSNTNYLLRIKPNGFIQFEYKTFANTSNNPLLLNQWNHIAVISDAANNKKVFVNNVLATHTGGTSPYGIVSNPLTIGAASYGAEYFNGVIDDIRIYKSALSDAAISSLFTNNALNINQEKTIEINQFYVSNNTLYFKNTHNLNDIKTVEVYNLLGQKVFNTSKIKAELFLNYLTKGVYILKVENYDGKISSLKFLME